MTLSQQQTSRIVAGYGRYSSHNQDGNLTGATQERMTREKSSERWPGLPFHWFFDEARSGTTVAGRDGLMKLMETVRAGNVQAVVTYRFDRLGRNLIDSELMAQEIERSGAVVLSVTEGDNKLVRQVLAIIAEEQARQTGERTRDNLIQLAMEGFPCGGPVPYGYVAVKVDDPKGRRNSEGKIVRRTAYQVDPTRAAIIVQIFQWYSDGMGLEPIAYRLNDQGVPSARGGTWDPGAVRAILRNQKYRGMNIFNSHRFVKTAKGKRVPRPNPKDKILMLPSQYIPRIITEELSARVERMFTSRESRGGSPGPGRKYALSGLATCAVCGGGCVVVSCTKKGHKYAYLVCGYAKRRGASVCNNPVRVRHDHVLEQLVEIVERGLFSPENLAFLSRKVRESLRKLLGPRNANRDTIQASLADTEKKIARLVDAIATGGNFPSLRERLRDLEDTRARLKLQLTTIRNPAERDLMKDLESAIASRVGRTVELLTDLTVDAFRQELERHVKEMKVFEDGSVKVTGTLEGLLEGAGVQYALVAGVGSDTHESGAAPCPATSAKVNISSLPPFKTLRRRPATSRSSNRRETLAP